MTQRSTHHRAGSSVWDDPTEAPVYFLSEIACYLRLPVTTIRHWTLGREYHTSRGKSRSSPLVELADQKRQLASFINLVELHILASIRRVHRLKPKPVRRAINYLRKTFSSDHPLLAQQMLTDGKDLFVEQYKGFVNISMNGQMHIKEMLDASMKRIEWDENHIPTRLFPFTRPTVEDAPLLIAIDPRVRSGKPCIAGTGIPTGIIIERHTAGDTIALLTKDYGRSSEEIEEALRYESRTAA
jgi:uncharacterized protein (DUF433 family)